MGVTAAGKVEKAVVFTATDKVAKAVVFTAAEKVAKATVFTAAEKVAKVAIFSGDSVVGCGVYVKTMKDIKKDKKFSEEGEYWANEGKKEERCPQGSTPDVEPLFPWVEGGELSTIEGNSTRGQTTRAANAAEVQNTKGSIKVHPNKRVEGNRRSMLCESWAAITQIGRVEILYESLQVDEAAAKSVVATRVNEVRVEILRTSQNWAKRI
ncbi:hypothetical protein V8G54_037614 [Vigna mungo]|uniref:Uncharacterized protein n=1 Tax=Vigna mungo TaxID=3915 RepID=A0AAQ3MJP1_VIGMU